MRFESTEVKLSKKGQRELTDFFGRELAYDYLNGHLDDERHRAFTKLVESNSSVREEIRRIQSGIEYARRLAEVELNAEVVEQINEPETYLSVLLQKLNFDQWPAGVKWALEAGVVLSVFLVALMVVPWGTLLQKGIESANQAMTLAEILRTPGPEAVRLTEIEKKEVGPFEDEGASPTAAPVASVGATVSTQKPATDTSAVVVAPKEAGPVASTGKTEQLDDKAEEKPRKPVEGFLYRGRLLVTNSPVVGPKIRDQITAMGGRKAGQVELGWERSAGVYYFHFTIPEARYDELKELLDAAGTLQISREKHPRVMPDGIVRLIVTVEEGGR